MHPNHSELVDIAVGAYLSVAPVTKRILETCEDDGYRRPTNNELCAILLAAQAQFKG